MFFDPAPLGNRLFLNNSDNAGVIFNTDLLGLAVLAVLAVLAFLASVNPNSFLLRTKYVGANCDAAAVGSFSGRRASKGTALVNLGTNNFNFNCLRFGLNTAEDNLGLPPTVPPPVPPPVPTGNNEGSSSCVAFVERLMYSNRAPLLSDKCVRYTCFAF